MKMLNPVGADDLAAVRAWFDTLGKHCRATPSKPSSRPTV